MDSLKLSSPWERFYKEIEALFKDDPEINIIYDRENNVIKLFVNNEKKADALGQLLPMERTFGNVTVKVQVIPGNMLGNGKTSLFQDAFCGNPALAYIRTGDNIILGTVSYVVFANKVVQYFNDDISDLHGNCSTLYQEIAKDVFGEQAGLFFCTEKGE